MMKYFMVQLKNDLYVYFLYYLCFVFNFFNYDLFFNLIFHDFC
ncbi:hypothetical protein C8P70_12152 [Myroides indicus]|uniref:Uncharacterized protein n=1 Tax=Myroides indicus TaxID=1323422 RepID=A0A4R7EZK1_9FLAO|nr:hypothetical protein C8P70_12152 [Myroides indicus]